MIECKISVRDFYAEKKKRLAYKDQRFDWHYKLGRMTEKHAKENGLELIELPRMGNYRFYMCEAGILSADLISKHAPDHGLLWIEGRTVKIVIPAPERKLVHKDAEIRYLRFAIINAKQPFEIVSREPRR